MKIHKAPTKPRPRPQPPTPPGAGSPPERPAQVYKVAEGIALRRREGLSRALQALFDEGVEGPEGLEGPVAMARVVGFVLFDWMPTILDIGPDSDDWAASADFNSEMERLAHETIERRVKP